MAIKLTKVIRAPVDDVFAFFDDLAKTLEFNRHAVDFEVVESLPDSRRTFDVVMRSGAKEWMQTVTQVIREPPARLVTRGGSWNTDRSKWLLTITTDRRFKTEGAGTRVDVTIDAHLDRPFRRPIRAIANWLHRGATRAEFEHQLDFMARRIEGATGPDRSR